MRGFYKRVNKLMFTLIKQAKNGDFIMTGNQLEIYAVHTLSNNGWWALRIPRNHSGAQPFDIIAVKGERVLALDCKACADLKFDIKRVEDNQWTAFEVMQKRTKAVIGILAENNGVLYFISYFDLLNCKRSYIRLEDKYNRSWVNVCHG